MLSGTDDTFEGVILAAGRGTRMAPFSEYYPKPLLPILNKPLIHRQIEYLRSIGVRRVYVVIGHLGHEIALYLRRGEALGVEIEYVEQRESLGIAHALMQLERHITRPFVLLLGDIYFEVDERSNPIECMRGRGAAGFLGVMRETDPKVVQRNFAVHMDAGGCVRRVVEKPRRSATEWKGCGVYVFDVAFFDALRRTPRSAARNEYEVTDAIQTFIDDGAKVVAEAIMKCDINLTYPYDVLLANLRALRAEQEDSLVAADAHIHPGATFSSCVVGARATIDAPVALRRCLVFPDARVSDSQPIDRVIITPDRIIDCQFWVDENGASVAGAGVTHA